MSNSSRKHLVRSLGTLLSVLLMLTAAAPASGQFGQNKVQYDDFDYQVIKTSHFDIYYYPAESEAAHQVARMSERWHERLSLLLGHQLTGRQAVILYASHPEFEQTNVVSGMIDESTGGITEGLQRRVVLPLAASLGETDHVLGHELVHAFQYDILGRAAGAVPLWFIEGMAEYLSIGPRHTQTAMWLRDAVLEDRLPTIEDLYSPEYFPYRFGHAFWAYIGGRWGDRMVGRILAGVAGGPEGLGGLDPITVIEAATEIESDVLSEQWHQSIRELYGLEPRPEEARDGERTGGVGPAGSREVVIGARSDSGSLNVGPALSPDGTKVAFLSGRGRLSIDLYVADTATGDVLHRLTRTAVDPHFQSLQFLQSAGTWSPDSRRLAVATVQSGRAVIVVFDVESGDVTDEIRLEQRGEVFQPDWSPDGNRLVYTAQIGGVTDLYIYDFDSQSTRQITDDPFADLQPSWSPDGERLAFVTDRFTSNLETLDFGPYRLASLELATGAVAPVETGLSGDAINPQWTTDGSSLLFISDDSGRPEVYRTSLISSAAQRTERLTGAVTGISGITPLSPALSVARGAEKAALTVFRDSGYEIQIHDAVGDPAAAASIPGRADNLAALPPENRDASLVAAELDRPQAGLPPTADFPTESYSPSLSLVAVGSSIGGATSSTFGTYVSGGVSFLFSDLLGNHTVSVGADINGGAKDASAQVGYINRNNRWNWGLFTEHVPLLSGTVRASTGVLNGQAVYVETTDLNRQTYTTVGAMVAYPFSRALRVEFSASGQRIGFSRERQQLVFDGFTGNLLFEDTEDLGGEPAIALAQASAALVRDTTAFGATGPILGQRFRLEASPTMGDLTFTNATADFRQYVMPFTPLTLAGRLLHVGRYGGGSEDQRLLPLFLGYPTLVRGYDVDSFEPNECEATLTGSCPAFDRLIGSRIAVINAEARLPLFGFGGNLSYGPIPTELFAFFDAGVAWTRELDPTFGSTGDREWVKSVGFGARVNVFGYAIAEFNMARPLDRPGREDDWMFVFNLRPGF